MTQKTWNVYLSGEIHTDWREQIMNGARDRDLPVAFTTPVADHDASDMCGVEILGSEEKDFWRDRKGAGINASSASVGRTSARSRAKAGPRSTLFSAVGSDTPPVTPQRGQ